MTLPTVPGVAEREGGTWRGGGGGVKISTAIENGPPPPIETELK